jgi:predicted AlkP superfamily phosphohydrolase/phosphomutase/Tfp pilus assembly protein PilF
METQTKKVLLIGWDAADWKVINPLLDSGQMPALARIVNNGVVGNIMTLDPPLSPMLWTSIATGKRADKHGIIGFMEPDIQRGGVRPINVTSRKTRAIWNILSSQGKKSNVIGWWPSHPAEPINGVMVSNFFQQFHKNKESKQWSLPKYSIYPAEYTEELARMRISPHELSKAHILPFIPKAAEYSKKEDYSTKYEKRISSLAKILAENSSVHAATTWLMENTEWDLTAVYFDGIDHACHGYMKFHPPQLPGLPDDFYELFKDVVNGMYIFHDMMLERLVELAGKDTTVIILSDHGFHSDYLRKHDLPKYAAAPALDHRQYGILCMSGNNIQKDELIYGASLLDITPTILTLFGLPVGKDMDGKVLMNAFEKAVIPEFIESWDLIEGNFGTHPADMIEDSIASSEAMKQLIELGYVEDFGEDKAKAMEKTVVECKYNLSRVYIHKKDFKNAIHILEELFESDKNDARFILALAKCYLQIREYKKSQDMIDLLKEIAKEDKFIPNTDILEANLLVQKGQHKLALGILKKIEDSKSLSVSLFNELGWVYLKIARPRDAIAAYSKALDIDNANHVSFYGLGCALLNLNDYEGAAQNLLNSIGLSYNFPLAHIRLGEALYKLEKYFEASQAFEVALSMVPHLIKPRQRLIKIYSEKLGQKENASMHENILLNYIKGTVYVVSGLPRSGTSMMMQMLDAGGLNVFTDKKRSADDHNPRGYYEHEAVKSLAKNNSWIANADGKVVKIIAQLLHHLPANFKYKIIFMQRDMNEIIKSQQIMLGKNPSTFPVEIASSFNQTIEKVKSWSGRNDNIKLLNVDYREVIENPSALSEKIAGFLDIHLDTDNMANAVSPELYRNKEL